MDEIALDNVELEEDNIIPLELYENKSDDLLKDIEANDKSDITWTRPIAIVGDPCLLDKYDKTIEGYCILGKYSPKWMPIIISIIQNKKFYNMIMKDIASQDNFNNAAYCGKFQFSLFGRNRWNEIIIDDRLPTFSKADRYFYCRSSNKEEFLPALLEKAFAVYYGGYATLRKYVSFEEALINITGGLVKSEDIGRSSLRRLDLQSITSIYKFIYTSLTESSICVCDSRTGASSLETVTKTQSNHEVWLDDSNPFDNSDNESESPTVLLPLNHYYLITQCSSLPSASNKSTLSSNVASIIDPSSTPGNLATMFLHLLETGTSNFRSNLPISKINSNMINLIRLLNPVLKGDWSGAYNVVSEEWDAIPELVKKNYNLGFEHESEFWIQSVDWSKSISNLSVCFIPEFSRLTTNMSWWPHFFSNFIAKQRDAETDSDLDEFSVGCGDTIDCVDLTTEQTMLHNHQYIVKVNCRKKVEIRMELSLENRIDTNIQNTYCNLKVFKIENNREYRVNNLSNCDTVKSLVPYHHSNNNCTLSVTVTRGQYLVLPMIRFDITKSTKVDVIETSGYHSDSEKTVLKTDEKKESEEEEEEEESEVENVDGTIEEANTNGISSDESTFEKLYVANSNSVRFYLRLYSNNRAVQIAPLVQPGPEAVKCTKCKIFGLFSRKYTSSNNSTECPTVKCRSCLSKIPKLATRMTICNAKICPNSSIDTQQSISGISGPSQHSYFVLKFNGSGSNASQYKYQSNVRYNTNCPEWNDHFLFYRNNPAEDSVHLEMFADSANSRGLLGSSWMSIGECTFTPKHMENASTDDDLSTPLFIPYQNEWIPSGALVTVRFKNYGPLQFDSI